MRLRDIRNKYKVPAYRGTRVLCLARDGWCSGSITAAYHTFVAVRPDKWPKARLHYHPLDGDRLIYIVRGFNLDPEDELTSTADSA